jgi:hypothetical protein
MTSSLDIKVRELLSLASSGGFPAEWTSPEARKALRDALLAERELAHADEVAFHVLDWGNEAAFLVAFLLHPDKFSPEEICEGVDGLLIHAPAHVMAAARLGGYEPSDSFEQGPASAT